MAGGRGAQATAEYLVYEHVQAVHLHAPGHHVVVPHLRARGGGMGLAGRSPVHSVGRVDWADRMSVGHMAVTEDPCITAWPAGTLVLFVFIHWRSVQLPPV